MNDKDKIKLVDSIIESLRSEKTIESGPKMVGHTISTWGINGFKKAEPGTPVFEDKERYFIVLETLSGDKSLEVRFYKEDFKQNIKFI